MKTRLLVTITVLFASPVLAQAECFGDHAKEQVTMSCPEGQSFDAATKSCVSPTG